MRFGQNPLKISQMKIEPPAAITVGVLNFIPDQTGYFQGQFDSLKLCLTSIRAHADQSFDMLVVDNGSCAEVRDYLATELEAGRIHYLILNQRNIGKANAQMQILRSAPGDLVFYSDGDIYYRPGWMKAHLDVFSAFPGAGMVGGIPLRNLADFHTAPTRRWADENQATLILEKGDLIPEDWTREFLRSVGDERFIENWIRNVDWRITCNGVSAYIGASHMQFLTSRQAIEKIPFQRYNLALHPSEDQHLDLAFENAGLLRISVDWPTVYHIGNSVSEARLVDEFNKLVQEQPVINTGSSWQHRHWFWGHWRVQRALKAIYEWIFKTYYENS
jgi:glycosyltransferase involved in cell wall biosynthesis